MPFRSPLVWAVLIAASALLAIAGEPLQQPMLLWLFKPLTTVLLIAFAWRRGSAEPALRRWLLAGLVLSLGGDVALLWPAQGFLPGLVSFLLAHLAYLRAFTRDTRFAARPAAFAIYAVGAGSLLAVLWSGVPAPMRVPVLVYVVALASMAAQALARWLQHREAASGPWPRYAAIGAALFVCSDALIAFDRFRTPLPHALVPILALYWIAQWCIAASLPAGNAAARTGTRTAAASVSA